jgi:serine/threonine protein kinase
MTGQAISHYRITDKLGEGGMGVVYKAEDTKLERTVALKFLAAHLVSDEDVRKRFEREAKAAAALNHPNICHVYEIDEADGKTFIAMAFIEGHGLDEKISAGPLKLNEALDIAHQIAQGLQAAHGKKIVHRDIKPANVMVTGAGSLRQVTVMDFGLAQLSEHSKLTRKNETLGTVAYMSPEQTAGAEVDHRSDIWALGCVLYELVSGQQPFKGHYNQAVMYSITNEEPEPITALRTGVPMELEWIVGKCLAKEADSRYQTAGELAVDLKNLQEKLKSGR